MRDAERLVTSQPKNYQDYLFNLMLAAAYAEAHPDRSFLLFEDMIGRINETISAGVKLAEFIDITGEFMGDGEIQVGSFGGSMIREMTRELGAAKPTVLLLAAADFERTRGLTNRFDRAEIRVLAKMIVLRAVFASGQAKHATSDVSPDGVIRVRVQGTYELGQTGSQ